MFLIKPEENPKTQTAGNWEKTKGRNTAFAQLQSICHTAMQEAGATDGQGFDLKEQG